MVTIFPSKAAADLLLIRLRADFQAQETACIWLTQPVSLRPYWWGQNFKTSNDILKSTTSSTTSYLLCDCGQVPELLCITCVQEQLNREGKQQLHQLENQKYMQIFCYKRQNNVNWNVFGEFNLLKYKSSCSSNTSHCIWFQNSLKGRTVYEVIQTHPCSTSLNWKLLISKEPGTEQNVNLKSQSVNNYRCKLAKEEREVGPGVGGGRWQEILGWPLRQLTDCSRGDTHTPSHLRPSGLLWCPNTVRA